MKSLKPRTTSDKWQVGREMFGCVGSVISWVCFLALVIFSGVCSMPYLLHGPVRLLKGGLGYKSFTQLANIYEVLDAILGTLIISTMIIGRYLSQLVKKEKRI